VDKNLKLEPGQGIGLVRFGMSEAEVIAACGPADKAYTDDTVRHLVYFEKRLDLWFDTESHHRLEWVSCSHPDIELEGARVIGSSGEDALRMVQKCLPEQDVELTDYGSFESHMFEESWIELQIEFGQVRSVSWGHFFDIEDKPVWPKRTN
jgi:hypothetical protein